MHNELPPNPVRLPLWRACLDDMRQVGITYGKIYPATFFEERIREKRDTMRFSTAISEIRKELERDGFYLSGRGHGGLQFEIVPKRDNYHVGVSKVSSARRELERASALLAGTDVSDLSQSDRRRHEGLLERTQIRLVLMRRAGQVATVIRKHASNLLK